MSNFVYKIRCALARFMYGRNGVDQLGRVMLYGVLVLCVARMFVQRVPGDTVFCGNRAVGVAAVPDVFQKSHQAPRGE